MRRRLTGLTDQYIARYSLRVRVRDADRDLLVALMACGYAAADAAAELLYDRTTLAAELGPILLPHADKLRGDVTNGRLNPLVGYGWWRVTGEVSLARPRFKAWLSQ